MTLPFFEEPQKNHLHYYHHEEDLCYHEQQATFTCASCQKVFSNSDTQRQHYQSDWHRFNLKRKIRDLPPVLEEVFESLLKEKSKTALESLEKEKPISIYCIPCKKSFSSTKSADSHSKSHRHLLAMKEKSGDSESMIICSSNATLKKDVNFINEEEAQAFIKEKLSTIKRLTHLDCLFCNENFLSAEDTLYHMKLVHSLFIPDHQYLTDLEGLLDYLGEKVSILNSCLWCPSSRSSFQGRTGCGLSGLRKHMADKGHQRIRFEEEDGRAELEPFYTYPLPSSDRMIIFNDDSNSDYEDVGDEDDSNNNEMIDYEGDERTLFISPDESEMLLPNGKKIGSRQYRIYYRQHLRDPTRLPSIRILNNNSSSTQLLMDGTERNLSINETMRENRKGLLVGGMQIGMVELLQHPSSLQHHHFDKRLGEFENAKQLFVRGQRKEKGDHHRLSLKTGMIQNVMRTKFFRHQLLQ